MNTPNPAGRSALERTSSKSIVCCSRKRPLSSFPLYIVVARKLLGYVNATIKVDALTENWQRTARTMGRRCGAWMMLVIIAGSQLMGITRAFLTHKVLLLHRGHEGSHAICESLRADLCLSADCSEQFDAWASHGRTNWNDMRHAPDDVVLFRASKNDLRRRTFTADVMLVIVRTDLMRWALSLYFKRNADKLDAELVHGRTDPQFTVNSSSQFDLYNLTLLSRTASECVRAWQDTVHTLDTLREMGRKYAVITYEQFVSGGSSYLARVLSNVSVTPNCSNAEDKKDDTPRKVHRVHGDDISAFAVNAGEVIQHFATTVYPSWPLLGGERHADHHPP